MSDYYPDLADIGPLFRQKPPSVQHSRTSVAAAESLDDGTVSDLQRQIIAFLAERGDCGATDQEMQDGIPMDQNTQRPRRRELALRGKVIEAGERKARSGKLATVWRLA